MVQFEDDEDAEVQWVGKKKLFEADASTKACTRKAAFACLGFLGDEERPFVAVDTPNQALVAVDTTEYTDTNDTTDTIDITDTYDITDTHDTIDPTCSNPVKLLQYT